MLSGENVLGIVIAYVPGYRKGRWSEKEIEVVGCRETQPHFYSGGVVLVGREAALTSNG